MMIKKLLIPLCTLATLALSASQTSAANFYLDTFSDPLNNTTQSIRLGRGSPTASNLKTEPTVSMPEVLGGSRLLEGTLISNPSNLISATTARVVPIRTNITPPNLNGFFDVANSAGVISKETLTYNANGVGLNNKNDAQGDSLGNWSTGKYGVDLFRLRVSALDLQVDVKFIAQDSQGKTISQTRTATKLANGSIVVNNPTNTDWSLLGFASNDAVFDLRSMIGACNCNFDLSSVQLAKIEFQGVQSADFSVDFIQGYDIPEPSLVVGTAIALGFGLFSTKRKGDDDSPQE